MIATIETSPDDHMTLTFETDHKELAIQEVQFAFIQASGKVEYVNRVTLNKMEERERWLGIWEGSVQASDSCSLVFTVISSV